MSAARELGGLAKRHENLQGQMVPAMQTVRAGRFRYSAPLVPWTDAEMEDLHSVWLRVHKAAWWLTPGNAAAPFRLPSENGGCPEVALAKHIEQLVALPVDLPVRKETIARYLRLCVACGCHTARELSGWLASQWRRRGKRGAAPFPALTCLWSARSPGTSRCLSFTRKGRERERRVGSRFSSESVQLPRRKMRR